MELMMYLGNDFIESVSVDDTLVSQPGYLGAFKRQLKQKHWLLIQETGLWPEFLIAKLVSDERETQSMSS